jgi:hypothetical protein
MWNQLQELDKGSSLLCHLSVAYCVTCLLAPSLSIAILRTNGLFITFLLWLSLRKIILLCCSSCFASVFKEISKIALMSNWNLINCVECYLWCYLYVNPSSKIQNIAVIWDVMKYQCFMATWCIVCPGDEVASCSEMLILLPHILVSRPKGWRSSWPYICYVLIRLGWYGMQTEFLCRERSYKTATWKTKK